MRNRKLLILVIGPLSMVLSCITAFGADPPEGITAVVIDEAPSMEIVNSFNEIKSIDMVDVLIDEDRFQEVFCLSETTATLEYHCKQVSDFHFRDVYIPISVTLSRIYDTSYGNCKSLTIKDLSPTYLSKAQLPTLARSRLCLPRDLTIG